MKRINFTLLLSFVTIFLYAQNNQKEALQDMSFLKSADKVAKPNASSNLFYTSQGGVQIGLTSSIDLSKLPSDTYSLTLQKANLQKIDKSILHLKNIEIVDVSHNLLNDIDVAIFQQLKKLKKIYVNNNPIAEEKITMWRQKFPKIQFFTDKEIYSEEYLNSEEYKMHK